MKYRLRPGLKGQTLAVYVREPHQNMRRGVSRRLELQILPGDLLDTTHDLAVWVKAGILDEVGDYVPPPPVPVDPVQVYLEHAAQAAVAGHAPTMADPRVVVEPVVAPEPIVVEEAPVVAVEGPVVAPGVAPVVEGSKKATISGVAKAARARKG
jgi:hypothetical protein